MQAGMYVFTHVGSTDVGSKSALPALHCMGQPICLLPIMGFSHAMPCYAMPDCLWQFSGCHALLLTSNVMMMHRERDDWIMTTIADV